jgi:hypothetical protein
MHWGEAQPETVKDYWIEVEQAGAWTKVHSENNNYQRRRVHRLSQAAAVNALRITVTATNGITEARICEVRVYR